MPPDPAGKNFLYKAWRKIEDESSFNPTLFTDAAFLGKTVMGTSATRICEAR
jgi:hypothetical protein